MEKVSIIVPIYNTSHSLRKCLDSLVEQTYRNVEILLIDDGSTDGSAEICKLYKKRNKQIIYIYQKNQGVSKARNTGLDYATGEYITFVDSDDYVKKDFIEILVKGIANNELSVCGYYLVNCQDDVIDSNLCGERREIQLTSDEYIDSLYGQGEYGYQGYPVNKLYLKKVIECHHLRFDEKIKYNEDRLFVLKYLLYCETIHYNEVPLYLYVQHKNSATGNFRKMSGKKLLTEFYAFENMLEILKKTGKKAYDTAILEACNRARVIYRYIERSEKKELKFIWRNWVLKIIKKKTLSMPIKVVALYRYLTKDL